LDRDHNAAINILRLAGQFPLFRAGQPLRALSRSLSDLPENPLALAMGSVMIQNAI
jgi:transposase